MTNLECLQYFRPSLSYIKLSFGFKTFVLSIFKCPLKTGFTGILCHQVAAAAVCSKAVIPFIVCPLFVVAPTLCGVLYSILYLVLVLFTLIEISTCM